MNQPKRIEKARILVANTPMDTDKIKVFGSKISVDSTAKVRAREIEREREKKEGIDRWRELGIREEEKREREND